MPYTPQLPDTIEDKMKLFEALCEGVLDHLENEPLSEAQRELIRERLAIAESNP